MITQFYLLFTLSVTLISASCGHYYYSSAPAPDTGPTLSEGVDPPYPSFSIEGFEPNDIVIPNVEGMRDTAFIVSRSLLKVVVAIDIGSRPMRLSERFAGLENPYYAAPPKAIVVASESQAFLLTATQVIAFDPRLGVIYSATSLIEHMGIEGDTIYPMEAHDIVQIGPRLFVLTTNTNGQGSPKPATVQAFDIGPDLKLTRAGFAVTDFLSPVALVVRGDRELVALGLSGDGGMRVDVVDANLISLVRTISIEDVTPSGGRMVVSPDGSRLFVGSEAAKTVIAIDLWDSQVNPYILGRGEGSISDIVLSEKNATIFAFDSVNDQLMSLDLSMMPAVPLPPINILQGQGKETTGRLIAIRGGTRGVDYNGEDVYVISGGGNLLIAIDSGRPPHLEPYVTDRPQETGEPEEEGIAQEPPPPPPTPPPTGGGPTPCQGFAEGVSSFLPGRGAGFGGDKMPNIVLGPPKGGGALRGSTDVVSLGRDGSIVLDLGTCPVVDGPGTDFIVFENAFLIGGNLQSPYSELGIVGVSEDGVNFTEFSCADAAYPYTGCGGWHPVYSHPDNGISPFDVDNAGGDAFDLADIGLAEVRFIRIRDRGGQGMGGASAGFDLDAVAVVNGVR